jgi:purine-binding chemotaxis protein CheW
LDERAVVEFLVVIVEGGRYGIRPSEVREVVRAVALSELRGAPDVFEGVINLRGEVVPVIDTRVLLGMPTRPLRPQDHLVIVHAGERLLALRVDHAVDLVTFAPAEVVLTDTRGYGMKCVREIARTPDGLLHVLSTRDILSAGESDLYSPAFGRSTEVENDG